MLRVTVNGEPHPLDAIPDRWDELLQVLDSSASRRDEVVAAVRFDGLEDPAFREGAARGRFLDALNLIEVATARPAHLIADALAQAADTARRLTGHALATASEFRDGRLEQASAGLREFAGGVGLLLATLDAIATVRGGAVNQLEWNGQSLRAHAESLTGPLSAIIDAHESRDWQTVADILEFDVQPTLETWPAMFGSLDQSHVGA